jgi:hypothetical protein
MGGTNAIPTTLLDSGDSEETICFRENAEHFGGVSWIAIPLFYALMCLPAPPLLGFLRENRRGQLFVQCE